MTRRASAPLLDLRPPRPLTARGEARRDAVLRAAAAEFLRYGFEGATIARITRAAGGSNSFIYKEFGDKLGLFSEVVAQIMREMDAELISFDLVGKSLEDGLFLFARAYLHALRAPKGAAVLRMVIAEAVRFPELRAPLISSTAATTDKLAEFIRSHPDRARLGAKDPREVAVMFASMLRGRFFLAAFNIDVPMTRSVEEGFTREAIAVLMRAYTG